MVRDTTAQAVYDRFYDSGRFTALKCQWKSGEADMPHIFWDSDVAKWIEGADNGEDLKTVAIDPKGVFNLEDSRFLLPSIMTIGYRPCAAEKLYTDGEEAFEELSLKLIPYYAFANRGETEMQVWLLRK